MLCPYYSKQVRDPHFKEPSAALEKLKKDELKGEAPVVEGYQQGVIDQLAFLYRDEIGSAKKTLFKIYIKSSFES